MFTVGAYIRIRSDKPRQREKETGNTMKHTISEQVFDAVADHWINAGVIALLLAGFIAGAI